MPAVIDLTVELALLAAAIVALALIKLTTGLVHALLGPVANLPFAGGVIRSAENAMTDWLNGLAARMTHWIARFFGGIAESLYLIVGVIVLAFYALFEFGKWVGGELYGAHGTATVAKLQLQLQNETTKARAAEAAAAHSIAALRGLVRKLDTELHAETSAAVTNLTTNVIPKLQHEVTQLEKEVAGSSAATLPGLKARVKAIEQSIAGINATVGTLQSEVTVLDNVPPYAPGTTTPPVPIPKPGAQGEPGARGEPGATGAPGAQGAPGTVGDIDLPGLGTIPLAAAVATTWAVTRAITEEAGLGRAECRGKVKGICGTDPLRWAELLAGLAAVGVGFSLGDVLEEAANRAVDLHGVMNELASGVMDAAPEYGAIIGGIANDVARAA